MYITAKVPIRDKRNRDSGNDGGREIPQEHEDDHHDERDGEHEFELHVFHRRANGGSAVRDDPQMDRLRHGSLNLRQQLLNRVDDADDVGSGLPLNVQDNRGVLIDPGLLLGIFSAVDHGGDVPDAHRRTVAISNDDGRVLGGSTDLIVIVDGP